MENQLLTYLEVMDSLINSTSKRKEDKTSKRKEARKRPRSRSPQPKKESNMEELVDYLPNRQFGDFYCGMCDSHMNSEEMWKTHVNGKRHLKNLKKGDAIQQKYEYSNEKPVIQKELDNETRPIAGLDHICEIVRNDSIIYQCFLCSANLTNSEMVIEHITGLKHQMAFLKEHDIEKYSLVDSSTLSKSHLVPIVHDLIFKYEQEHGRGKISVKKEIKKPKSSNSYKISYEDGGDKRLLPKTAKYSPSKISTYLPPKSTRKHSQPDEEWQNYPVNEKSREIKYFDRSYYSNQEKESKNEPESKMYKKASTRLKIQDLESRNPVPKSPRYSPPKSARFKKRKFEMEWNDFPVRGKSRDRSYSDRSYCSDEEIWEKNDPEPIVYGKAPTDLEIRDSRSEEDNYCSHSWEYEEMDCCDLRVVLEKKKNTGMSFSGEKEISDVSSSVPFASEINCVSDKLLRLIADASPEEFLRLALFKLDKMDIKENTELKLLNRVVGKAKTLVMDTEEKFLARRLKAKYKENLAQNGISSQSNNTVDIPPQSNLRFRKKDNLVKNKIRKHTMPEDVSSRLLKSIKQSTDSKQISRQQLSNTYPDNAAKEETYDSGWNQMQSNSMQFPSFSSTSTNIPGLAFTDESLAEQFTSAVMSQFFKSAKHIFSEIIPAPPTNPYKNEVVIQQVYLTD